MNAERLLELYERVADAPDAIDRLRRFLLDLAVRGKLVEQRLSEEPAQELLRRIGMIKDALVKEKEIKKPKTLPPIDEVPFDIPGNWTWVQLDKITSYIQRGKSPKYAMGEGLPVISQKCVQWAGLDLDVAKQITVESLEKYENIRFLRDGDLLWNSTGTGTIGRVIRLVHPPANLVCDSHVTVVRCLEVDPEYIRAWLRTDHVYGAIEERASGSTNQVELTAQMALNQPVPLPPVAEQKRIVAKVDELMGLLDRLEAARTEREVTRDRLTAVSLARLTAPETDAEAALPGHARFALDALPALTARPDQIKQLRQTILDLAVLGKLVKQNPNDEPASELLVRISNTKKELIRSGLIRGRVPKIKEREDTLNLTLPQGWQLTTLGDVALKITDGAHKTPTYVEKGVPFISVKDFSAGQLSFGRTRFISEQEHAELYKRCDPRRGDIILGRIGTLGKATIVDVDFEFSLFVSVGLIRFDQENMNPEFLKMQLNSPFVEAEFNRIKVGGGTHTNKLNLGDLHSVALLIPPLAEQRRIVAKVDALMALCDQLEAALTNADATRQRLLEALLHEALEPAQAEDAAA